MSFDREESAFDHSLVNLFNAELSPEMCSRGPRCCGEEGVGDYFWFCIKVLH